MSTQIKFRRDTSTNWSTVNPRLGSGEPGLETDTGKVKIGDGSTEWHLLNYVFNGFVASYANLNVAQYLPTYTGNLKAGNVNAVNAVYSPAYYYSNGVAFVGGGSGTTYSNTNVANYLPTYAGNVNAANFVSSTAVYAPAYYFANGVAFTTGSTYSNANVAAYLPTFSGSVGGTLSTAAQNNITSVGTLSSLSVTGSVTANTLTGTLSTAAQPNITSVGTLVSLGVVGTITATTLNASTIGNADASLQGSTVNVTGAIQGNTHVGVAVYAGTIGNTGANLVGTIGTNAQPYINSVGTLTGLTSSGIVTVTNGTNTISSSTGAVVVTGGVGIAGNLYVAGNITAGNVNYVNTTTLSATAPVLYLTTGAVYPYNYEIGFYSNMFGSSSNVLAYTGFVRNHVDNVWHLFSNIGGPIGSSFNLANAAIIYDTIKTGGQILANTTSSTSSTTGALQVAGGAGISGNLNVGQGIIAANGAVSTGIFVGPYSDGIILDYQDNNGRVSVGTGDSLSFYTGGPMGTKTATIAANGAFIGTSIQNTPIGNATASTGAFTTLGATGNSTLGTVTASTISSGTIGNAGASLQGSSAALSNAVTANTFTGVAVYAGTIGNTGATLTGTLSTAAQTNITSVGTLTALNISGTTNAATINASTVQAGTIGNSGASIVGTIATASQTNITSVGTLGSLGVGTIITAGTLNAGTIGNAGANFIGANVTASGNIFANTYGIYAGSYYWANGASFSGSSSASYSNTDVTGYLLTYSGNLNAGNLNLYSNTTIAATPINSSTYGEIQSNRMMGRYNTSTQGYFELTGTATVGSNDAAVANRIPTRLDTNSGSEILQPAYGAGYGIKKVGLGFHTGTYNDILTASVSGTPNYSNNVNAVVLGYMNNGPRLSMMDYSLVDDTPNVMAFTSSVYKFYSATGSTIATIDSTTKNITATGNIFANSGTIQSNIFTGVAMYASTIGNTGTYFNGATSELTGASQAASYTTINGGQITGYLTGAIGANTANSGTFTSVTTTSGGQITGYLTGAIGANTANSGTFTTASSTNLVSTTAFYSNGTANINSMTATTITAGTIGNSGAVIYGTLNTASQPNITGVGTLGVLAVTGTISAGIHAGALNGSHNGTVGASTPNTGAFTTLTTTGDVTVAGNLYVNGNSTIINANNVSINDTLIYLANSNPANSYDIGFVGHFTAGTYQHTGLVRQASTNTWTFFSNVSTEPSGNVLTFDANTAYDAIKVGNISTVNGIYWANGTNFASTISGNYGNTQVATYLPTYQGALTANNFTGASIYAGTIGNTGANLVGTINTNAQTYITSIGTLTGLTVSGAIVPNANNTINLGNSGAYWNTIYGVAIQAKYADLAECYAADTDYAPGTVLDFGGTNEVTLSTTDASRRVAGVVTTNPAYLMNSQLEAEFIAAIALQGRVPTLVQGPVMKGDSMVSAGNGRARSEADPKISTVIGKALEDFNGDVGVIEVVVGRN
jgi:hypothetical protein